MNLKEYIIGNRMERMPDIAFRAMSLVFRIRDFFSPPEGRIGDLGIEEGFTIVDYGCGPGRYVKVASRLVGEKGKVYAVDIHELAVEAVKERIHREGLTNVVPLLARGYSCDIPDHEAHMIYALDMFHMVREPTPFLKELHRILKPDGFLVLETGHQPVERAAGKVRDSGSWRIVEQGKGRLRCEPL
ncbi:MAG: class I SAM-dependent methyltransferase [Deltaproteobacteria bacterium]|nr:class I SAM-dependent methyltransferase [Deltaproteobacteria bacterium]